MKKIFSIFAVLAFVVASMSACQDKDSLTPDPSVSSPTIGEATFGASALIYGDELSISVPVSDEGPLSNIEISVVVNNAVLYTNNIPAENQKSITVTDDITLPFGKLAIDMNAEVVVTAMNKSFKQSERSFELALRRPELSELRFVPTDTSLDAVVLVEGDDFQYEAICDYANNVAGYIVSAKGYEWGFDAADNACSLVEKTAIVVCDSENVNQNVTKISFNALTFEVAPLKKERTINGVAFMPYKMSPDDSNAVGNCYKATNVALVKGDNVTLELINPDEFMFDPDYFVTEDGRLCYIGESGNVTLYLNTAYKFVFVTTADNPISGDAVYPDVLFVNGWGIGRPTMWDYNPNWDFSKTIIFRKESSTATESVYLQTVIFSKWVTFKFYNGKDWGNEINPNDITYLNDDFKTEKESGKDSYNICTKDGDGASYKSAIAKIKLTIRTNGSYLFESKILKTSDQD